MKQHTQNPNTKTAPNSQTQRDIWVLPNDVSVLLEASCFLAVPQFFCCLPITPNTRRTQVAGFLAACQPDKPKRRCAFCFQLKTISTTRATRFCCLFLRVPKRSIFRWGKVQTKKTNSNKQKRAAADGEEVVVEVVVVVVEVVVFAVFLRVACVRGNIA